MKQVPACRSVLCLAALLNFVAIVAAEEFPAAFYEDIRRGSVEVLVNGHMDGTGWIADPAGLVCTVAHAITGPNVRVEVRSEALGRLDAVIVAVNRGSDIALLQLPERKEAYPVLKRANSVPAAGNDVFLYGTPLQRHSVLIKGAMARNDNTVEFFSNLNQYVEVTHVTAPSPPGVSGGPWLNSKGEVIGHNSGLMKDGTSYAGIAFMVPVSAADELLITRTTAHTADSGCAFEELWQHGRDRTKRFPAKQEGVFLRVIKEGGPAERAGLKEWDAITEINGKPVVTPDDAVRIIRSCKPESDAVFTQLLPDGAGTKKITVRLGVLEVEFLKAKKGA